MARRDSRPVEPNPLRRPEVQRRLRALRAGVTSFAVLGGIACYALLAQVGVPTVIAGLAGLIFALLTRLAVTALVRDWLRSASAARDQASTRKSDNAPPRTQQRR